MSGDSESAHVVRLHVDASQHTYHTLIFRDTVCYGCVLTHTGGIESTAWVHYFLRPNTPGA